MELTDRQKEILVAIIEAYAKKGGPISSKELVRQYDFPYSSATIRAEMAILEELKLLEKPHTSGGRVPTDKSYRFYVNELMTRKNLEKEEKAHVKKSLSLAREKEDFLPALTEVLSELTDSLVLASARKTHHFSFSGLKELLEETEDLDFTIGVTRFLEDVEQDIEGFFDKMPDDEPQVYIGKEHPLLKQKGCGLILSRYQKGDDQGFLALVGPTKMDYEKNLSLLTYVTKLLENF